MRAAAGSIPLALLTPLLAQDAVPAAGDAALQRGAAFLRGPGRQAFLDCLEAHPVPADARIEIAWLCDGRRLATLLSRTRGEIAAMTEDGFLAWRDAFSVSSEAEHRRRHPLPDELRGYGGAGARAAMLKATRELIEARSRDEYLDRAGAPAQRGHVAILFVPRGGQGATAYAIPLGEVAELDEPMFQRWRQRFLRWIEIHTPGQSQVRRLAALGDDEFESLWAESKDRFPFDFERAREAFHARTGLWLLSPCHAAGARAARLGENPSGGVAQPGTDAAAPQPGDTILAVEGTVVAEWYDCTGLILAYRPGSTLLLEVRDAGGAQCKRLLTLR